MTATVQGGHFRLSRQVYISAIWRKQPSYLRFWIWLIGKAAYQEGHIFKGHALQRGELITTYAEITEALSFTVNRRIIKPTLKEIRVMLDWLESQSMILVKPLTGGTLPNQGRPTDRTRAYVGLLIYIINYDTYQAFESYQGSNKGRHLSEQGQTTKRSTKEKNILSDSESDFSRFYKSYPKHEGKKKAQDAWAKIKPNAATVITIINAIERQKSYKADLKSRGEFCPEWPLPASWLNGRRWEDEVPEVKKATW